MNSGTPELDEIDRKEQIRMLSAAEIGVGLAKASRNIARQRNDQIRTENSFPTHLKDINLPMMWVPGPQHEVTIRVRKQTVKTTVPTNVLAIDTTELADQRALYARKTNYKGEVAR